MTAIYFEKNLVKLMPIVKSSVMNFGYSTDTLQCGKTKNPLWHFFNKNFVKVTFLLKKLPEITKKTSNEWEFDVFFTLCTRNFDKKFVKVTFFLKKLISRKKKLWWERISCFFTLWSRKYHSWFHEIFLKQ